MSNVHSPLLTTILSTLRYDRSARAFTTDAIGWPQVEQLERELVGLEVTEDNTGIGNNNNNNDDLAKVRKQLTILGRHTTGRSKAIMLQMGQLFERCATVAGENQKLTNALGKLSVDYPFLLPSGERLFYGAGDGEGGVFFFSQKVRF